MPNIETKKLFLNFIQNNNLLNKGDVILVAISGGPDSVALSLLLNEIKDDLRIEIALFHLDHKIRKNSYKDVEFVKILARNLKLNFYHRSFDVKSYAENNAISIQEAGRNIRYKLLDEIAYKIKATKIATGHHKDDQLETFFLRLLRGAGLAGLRSIPIKRNNIIRPLLCFSKVQLLDYLNEKGQNYLKDPSNIKPIYMRNKIRGKLMPLIEEINPQYKEVILKNIDLINEEENLIEKISTDLSKHLIGQDNNMFSIDYEKFGSLSKGIKRRVLREFILISKGDLIAIEVKHIDLIIEGSKKFGFTLQLPGGNIVYRDYKKIFIGPKSAFKLSKITSRKLVPGQSVDIKPLNLKLKTTLLKTCKSDEKSACIDYEKIKPPLRIRGRKPGDRFEPLGTYGTKKLQDFLVDKKIGKHLRDSVIIVEDKEKIVWVAPYRIDNRVKIDKNTKQILKLELV